MSLKSNIYIRADLGHSIGDGHLFRTKALAEQFARLGHKVTYVSRQRPGFDSTKFEPFSILELSKNDDQTFDEISDALECLQISQSTKSDIWIVDHYKLGADWETKVRESAYVVAIDDLFRPHAADLVLDHNVTASADVYKNKSLNSSSQYLMGPSYCLLRDKISSMPQYSNSPNQKGLLLYLGTCSMDTFTKVLTALRACYTDQVTILNAPGRIDLRPNEKSLPFTTSLNSLYFSYEKILGACGVAQLERMALGVPTITCGVVDNQFYVSSFFDKESPEVHLGFIENVSESDLQDSLHRALNIDQQKTQFYIDKFSSLVKKNGASKAAAEIIKFQRQRL